STTVSVGDRDTSTASAFPLSLFHPTPKRLTFLTPRTTSAASSNSSRPHSTCLRSATPTLRPTTFPTVSTSSRRLSLSRKYPRRSMPPTSSTTRVRPPI